MKSVEDFIRRLADDAGRPLSNVTRQCVERGAIFTSAPKPPGVRFRGQGQCFAKAQAIALDKGHLYVEGLAWGEDEAHVIHHAWNSADGRTVIDATWRVPPSAAIFYAGIMFPPKAVASALLERSRVGSDWRPLL